MKLDPDQLLAQAPDAVNSYFPGHWELMRELEHSAKSIIANEDPGAFAKFLRDVAFLKQPRRDHQRLWSEIESSRSELTAALDALRDIDRLDYSAMDRLARVPGFGRTGRRTFNSAVVRLVRPEAFGIIDWRNLAVLMSAHGFEGLIEPPLHIKELPSEEVLRGKGRLILTQQTYELYNNTLREIAREHGKSVSEIDLILWTFSILKRPFSPFLPRRSVASAYQITPADRHLLCTGKRENVAKRIIETYISGLSESADFTSIAAVGELSALFALIRDEAKAYARTKPRVTERVRKVVNAFDSSIKSGSLDQLLSLWSRWNDLVNPASPTWIGIDLPGSMIRGGFMVLEDFPDVKKFIEQHL